MPVADIVGSKPGPVLLVTAGLDGDEYAPIAAAFEAAERYQEGAFAGRLVILPLVNEAGFEARVSKNPIDGKYPKYCIPGRLFGTTSERLMRRIVQTYARHAVLWLDLHSNPPGETVIPHIWNSVTGIETVDTIGKKFCVSSGADAAVREPASAGIYTLARKGCAYAMAESEDEAQHLAYIERAMQVLGMTSNTSLPSKPPRLFAKSLSVAGRGAKECATIPDALVLWHKTTEDAGEDGRWGEIAYEEITE